MEKTNRQPIGILGGTFDPIHNGHIQIASIALEQLPLQKIQFMPCFQPSHREQPQTSSTDRLAMVKLAIENHPGFEIDDREIKRRGISYMIDTLKSLRNDYPQIPLCLILGTDAFNHLAQWRDWEQLINYAHLIVIFRDVQERSQLNSMTDWAASHLTHHVDDLSCYLQGKIYYLAMKPIPISATEIRDKIKTRSKDLKNELPEKVLDYIKTHHLYGTNSE
ncbi:MAG TPA: nicotinic acid mononucleotide adenylyltransferase [Coxiellaceae bacterium]|nr:nicotinic acid mononucleotide adenylyltransferase [Coxiellaceae bacterium]